MLHDFLIQPSGAKAVPSLECKILSENFSLFYAIVGGTLVPKFKYNTTD